MAIYLGSERVKISMVEEEGVSSEIMESIISGTIESYYNNRVSYVGSYAFTGQVNLISADFPNCNYIGSEAFEFCINLTSVNSPNCSYIGDMAFFQCSSLITISFPNCSYIGNAVFHGCNNLATINLGVSSISSNNFRYCSNLTSINLPNCTYIESNAFYDCSNLTTVNLPNCTYIGDRAFNFEDMNSLWTLALGFSSISDNAFEYCSNLISANFPNCSYIGDYAFYRCTNLIMLNLTSVSAVPTLADIDAFYSTPIGGYSASAGQYGSVYVPASLYSSFLTATYWSSISSRIVSV